MGKPRIPFRGRAIKPMLRKAYDDESLPPDQRKGGAGEKYAEIPIGIWDLVHLGSPRDRESGARFNVNLGFRCPSPPASQASPRSHARLSFNTELPREPNLPTSATEMSYVRTSEKLTQLTSRIQI